MNRIFGHVTAVVALFAATASAAFAQTPLSPTLGRNLAAQCANCHGTNGKSAAEVPSLAGEPAAIIVQKMKDYRDGKIPATIMHQLSKGYSDEQVALMADFFSKQAK
jgi:cytochrome subunit of sulfide dehydrogenase